MLPQSVLCWLFTHTHPSIHKLNDVNFMRPSYTDGNFNLKTKILWGNSISDDFVILLHALYKTQNQCKFNVHTKHTYVCLYAYV